MPDQSLPRRTIPNTDLHVSAICYGTAGIGSLAKGEQIDALLDTFRGAGGNFLDTAHCYAIWRPEGDGCSERAIADYVRRRKANDLVIATKGGHPALPGYRKVDRSLSPARIGADIDDSLGRLGRNHLDLYWLHRDDPATPVSEIMDTLSREVKRGRLRFLGASNWAFQRIEEANRFAAENNIPPFVASQPQWSLAHRNTNPDATANYLLEGDIAWHTRQPLAVIPYSPTACGYFATAGQGARDAFDNPTSQERLARVTQLAAELRATPTQIALAYLMSHPFPVIPIVGTSNPEHLRDALAAAALKLTPPQAQWLAS